MAKRLEREAARRRDMRPRDTPMTEAERQATRERDAGIVGALRESTKAASAVFETRIAEAQTGTW